MRKHLLIYCVLSEVIIEENVRNIYVVRFKMPERYAILGYPPREGKKESG